MHRNKVSKLSVCGSLLYLQVETWELKIFRLQLLYTNSSFAAALTQENSEVAGKLLNSRTILNAGQATDCHYYDWWFSLCYWRRLMVPCSRPGLPRADLLHLIPWSCQDWSGQAGERRDLHDCIVSVGPPCLVFPVMSIDKIYSLRLSENHMK